MQKENHNDRPFPFGNEGPPNKRERRFVDLNKDPETVDGFIPGTNLSFLVHLQKQGVKTLTATLVALMLHREKGLSKKFHYQKYWQTEGWLRTPKSKLDELGISSASHSKALKKLEAAGIVELAESTRGLVARLLIEGDPKTKKENGKVTSKIQKAEPLNPPKLPPVVDVSHFKK